MNKFLLILLLASFSQSTFASDAFVDTTKDFSVRAFVNDPGCMSENPWDSGFKDLFNRLRSQASTICTQVQSRARLIRNNYFSCRDSILTGVQTYNCSPAPPENCDYGKCCPGGVCD